MDITKNIVDSNYLCNVTIPIQTSTYKPVSHRQLIDFTLESLYKHGFVVKEGKYLAASSGKIATAYYDTNYGGDPEMGLRIAWQNSYNKQVSLKFAIGANVFVCTNGAFFGTIGAFKKKHVGVIQEFTPSKIEEYINIAKDDMSFMIQKKDDWKKKVVDRKTMARIIGDMYISESLIKETQLSIIKKEINNPSFSYNAPDSQWELYNYVTHSLKTVHPSDYIDSHVRIHQYFEEAL